MHINGSAFSFFGLYKKDVFSFLLFLIAPTDTWVIVLLGFLDNKNCCSFVSKLYKMTFEPETKTMKFSAKKFILSGDMFIPNFGFSFIPFVSIPSVYTS